MFWKQLCTKLPIIWQTVENAELSLAVDAN